MRSLPRALAALATSAALVAGAFATPAAAAGPADGEGCVGFPSIPAAYVCVISLTPAAVVPTTTTTTIPVSVPEFCYAIDCVGPTTVNVPVPGVTPGSGVVAVLWYDGQYIPIAVGTVPGIPSIGGLPDTSDILWLPFELVFGSRDEWIYFREGLYDLICATSLDKVCL